MVGLGRMGGNMAQRLLKGGHRVVTYDQSPDAVSAAKPKGLWVLPRWSTCWNNCLGPSPFG